MRKLIAFIIAVGFVLSGCTSGEPDIKKPDRSYHALFDCPDGNFSGGALYRPTGIDTQDLGWALYDEHRRFIVKVPDGCKVTILKGDWELSP